MSTQPALSSIWIKICGITRAEDARAAQALGVDAIGLVFYPPSPRAVTATQAAAALSGLDGQQTRRPDAVGLFVNPTSAQVQSVLDEQPLALLQFHGDEPAEFCESFGLPYMKAFRVQSAQEVITGISAYPTAKYILLDSYKQNIPGGTGTSFDWTMAADIVARSPVPIVLAGGLHPENIQEAISVVNPFGVDVSSGVEAAPGLKDTHKMQLFVEGVRRGGV